MDNRHANGVRSCITVTLLIAILLVLPLMVAAQEDEGREDYDTRRARALKLKANHKFELALPQLQILAEERPDDVEVLVALGFSLLGHAGTLEDPEERRLKIIEAREAFLRAEEVGGMSQHALGVLEILPEDGVMPPFSADATVQETMQVGEAAFVTGKYDEALAAYEQAHLLDPEMYEAVLFIGDVYYAKKDIGPAGAWFGRAIELDPNREVAYRYWGDALLQDGAPDEALEKYLGAIVAEPYAKISWAGLIKWGKRVGRNLAHPVIQSPNRVAREGDNNNIRITIDSGSRKRRDGTGSWFIYELFRAARMAKDKDESDDEEKLSPLEDEASALTSVAKAVQRDMDKGEIDNLEPGLAILLKLHEAGLVEAYVLISRVDEGIAQDYPEYREANREKLIRYVREYIIQPRESEKGEGSKKGKKGKKKKKKNKKKKKRKSQN